MFSTNPWCVGDHTGRHTYDREDCTVIVSGVFDPDELDHQCFSPSDADADAVDEQSLEEYSVNNGTMVFVLGEVLPAVDSGETSFARATSWNVDSSIYNYIQHEYSQKQEENVNNIKHVSQVMKYQVGPEQGEGREEEDEEDEDEDEEEEQEEEEKEEEGGIGLSRAGCGSRRVSFDDNLESQSVTPYSEVYGRHPLLFDFDANGFMLERVERCEC
mmetsp:Transcript_24850/g.65284  ORF Transcript_24850/g.65284 Transcript_24850/m.65284 type:complete len:216 (-) Transcript_24850:718-1365(-)